MVIPGSRCSPTWAIVAATRSPARAMRSISSGPLRMITDELPPRSGEDVVDACSCVDRAERPGCPVALDDRLCLLMVDGEPPRHHVGRVVASRFSCALQRPYGRRPVVEIEEQHRVERPSDRAQHLVERLGLDEVARKPVQDEPTDRVVLREPVADQRDRQLVGHELAGCEDRRDLEAELGPVGDGSAEHVPRET